MPEADIGAARSQVTDLQLLLEAAAGAGEIAMRYFRASNQVWLKDGQSPVSEADFAVDKFLRETLLAARPDYGWLSEETADDLSRTRTKRQFVVDPIDGTRGFLEGGSRWCVSVAVVEAGRPIAGVLECPARQERYWAEAGQGAFLNGARLAVPSLGEPARLAGPEQIVRGFIKSRTGRIEPVAYIPSLAYRIAMIADGRLDATFVKPNAHDWDLAAADLILAEVGGKVLTAMGRPPEYGTTVTSHGVLAAGTGDFLEEMFVFLAAREDAD